MRECPNSESALGTYSYIPTSSLPNLPLSLSPSPSSRTQLPTSYPQNAILTPITKKNGLAHSPPIQQRHPHLPSLPNPHHHPLPIPHAPQPLRRSQIPRLLPLLPVPSRLHDPHFRGPVRRRRECRECCVSGRHLRGARGVRKGGYYFSGRRV